MLNIIELHRPSVHAAALEPMGEETGRSANQRSAGAFKPWQEAALSSGRFQTETEAFFEFYGQIFACRSFLKDVSVTDGTKKEVVYLPEDGANMADSDGHNRCEWIMSQIQNQHADWEF